VFAELVVVTVGCFTASFVNAAFATGGIYIILACSTAVFPISVAVPLQSAFAFSSLAARVVYFWSYIYWPVVAAFIFGSAIGVAAGASVFVTMPEAAISLLLSILLLFLVWAPPVNVSMPFNHPFFPVGIAHSFLGTVFGVGALLQPAILRTDLRKLQITATLAACLITMDCFKLTAYVYHGFRYSDYLYHIALATGAGVAGTFAGKRIEHQISENTFRIVFKWLITLVALRLLYRGLTLL